MGRRRSTRARTWVVAAAVVAGLSTAGIVAVVSPTLGAGPQPPGSPSHDRSSVGDGPRAVASVGVPAVRARFGPKPNVVVVMTDDMRVDDLRWMPTVRREMRQGGIEFRNSFSPNPLCCPARASFFSGQLSHNHGVVSHLPPWGFRAFRDRGTIATALRRSGYRTALVGKYLNGYGQQTRRNGRPSLHYVPPGWTDWFAAFDPPPGNPLPGGTYNYLDQPMNHDGRTVLHRRRYSTVTTGDVATRLVERYARTTDPFFLYLAFVAPHFGGPHEADDPAYTPPGGGRERLGTPWVPRWVRGRFDRLITKAPGFGGDADPSEVDVSDKPAYVRARPEPNRSMERAALESARQRAESLYVVDRQVARLVAALKRTGEWDHTVLFLTSDNGFFMGEHRHIKGKIKPYEPSTRVPFLVTGPGLREGTVRYDPITTVDLTATVLELGRAIPYLAADHPLDGRSRLTTLLRGDQGWTAPVLTESHMWPATNRAARRALGFTSQVSYVGLRTPRYAYSATTACATTAARRSSTTCAPTPTR